ncbi:BZ3500_MvSof-1268-A1-R1_Chr1-1g01220 [Microbotryum saponariae]|uniref:BZ3500_MvSof-1268-A1-R1_Chr1-1g01220 protein n=1 Tax=Microbotryum saponariae TaxID=289078 RepID=A0A2X0KQC0_9BASI|nr:BZ3500_MvSof-1268-A1-R1_Chr1-1g01220 [Microbotryum saponariae]SCZ93706.1 BZ3501_MvSof-1269-A2-R1_Chr1-1g00816 [Microbotryum saponariae]
MQSIRNKFSNSTTGVSPSTSSGIMKKKGQVCVSFAMMFMLGFNIAATGANVPSISASFHVAYSVISMFFLSYVTGFITTCVASSYVAREFGVRATLAGANILWIFGCLIFLLQTSFGACVLALTCLGLGSGLFEPTIVTVVTQQSTPVVLSFLYSSFAIGAGISPLIIGGFAERSIPWTNFYYFPVTICSVLAALCHIVFQGYEEKLGQDHAPSAHRMATFSSTYPGDSTTKFGRRASFGSSVMSAPSRFAGLEIDRNCVAGGHKSDISAMGRIGRVLRLRVAWIGFFLVNLSLATGELLGGWGTTYFLVFKEAPPGSSRFIQCGWWFGMALGRLVLPILSPRVLGERLFAIVLLAFASCMITVIGAVHSYKSDAVALAFYGFAYGPIVPHILSMVSSRVSTDLTSTVISLTLGVGVLGGAAAPILFGAIAVDHGMLSVFPTCLIAGTLLGVFGWLLVPDHEDELKSTFH